MLEQRWEDRSVLLLPSPGVTAHVALSCFLSLGAESPLTGHVSLATGSMVRNCRFSQPPSLIPVG